MSIAPSPRLSADVAVANELPVRRKIGGRYQVLRSLKTGDDTETVLAIDLKREANVVIKTASSASFSASARMRLEHEAHVLSQIKQDRFVPLLDSGFEGDQVFLVMPLIP
jgi:serine/threonine protein kinase